MVTAVAVTITLKTDLDCAEVLLNYHVVRCNHGLAIGCGDLRGADSNGMAAS